VSQLQDKERHPPAGAQQERAVSGRSAGGQRAVSGHRLAAARQASSDEQDGLGQHAARRPAGDLGVLQTDWHSPPPPPTPPSRLTVTPGRHRGNAGVSAARPVVLPVEDVVEDGVWRVVPVSGAVAATEFLSFLPFFRREHRGGDAVKMIDN